MPTDNPDVKKNVHPVEPEAVKEVDLDTDRTVLAGRVLDDPPDEYVQGETLEEEEVTDDEGKKKVVRRRAKKGGRK